MMTSLKGKVITVTGAGSGIGLATAHLLASRGATVSICDVRDEALEAAVAAIRKASPSAELFSQSVDVAQRDQVEAWLDATVEKFGKLHGAANIAGVYDNMPGTPVQELEDKAWHRIIDINLHGVFFCMRRQLRSLEDEGSIVNMSSIFGLAGMPNTSAYCASKHAVIGLSKAAAKEVFDRKIRVNCVAPGYVDTPALRGAGVNGDEPQFAMRIQRMCTPEEVASLVAFLLGDESKYVTGSTYTIDGGVTA